MFDPFGVSIGSLTAAVLQRLVDDRVAEGLFVEYKERPPAPDAIAKAIAAFANSRGGWLFIGVAAKDNVAELVQGCDRKEWPGIDAKVRDSCKSHITPFPYFETRIVEIGVERTVCVVRIPPSDECPHITRDGRVYVRKADSSSPVALAERSQLDALYARSETSLRDFARFAVDEREPVPGIHSSFLSIYISTFPPQDLELDAWSNLDGLVSVRDTAVEPRAFDFFGSIVHIADLKINVPFNRAYVSGHSVFLEQQHFDAQSAPLTFELHARGKCKIHIPVAARHIGEMEIETDAVKTVLETIKQRAGVVPLFFDAGRLWLVAIHLVGVYIKLLGNNLPGRFRVGLELRGTTWFVPIVDSAKWADAVSKVDIPLNRKRCIQIPEDFATPMVAEDVNELRDRVMACVASLIGLPLDILGEGMTRNVLSGISTQHRSPDEAA